MFSLLEKKSGYFQNPSLVLVLWYGVVLASLVSVLAAFVIGSWSWGLMDDPGFVIWGGNIWERSVTMFKAILSGGMCRPVYAFHSGIFYKLFEHQPGIFYIFRWFEVSVALGIWGFFAFLVTRRTVALPLLICVALSFNKFYDAFFYLSTPDILGVLFSGCAGIFLFRAFGPAISRQGQVQWLHVLWGVMWLCLAVGSKEPFVIIGVAWGLSLIISGLWKPRKNSLWLSGLLFLVLSLFYGFFVKFFVSKGYTADYVFSDFGKIGTNMMLWARVDLVAHGPWIAGALILMLVKRPWELAVHIRRWAVSLGIGIYVGYALVLLPWSTTGHYSTPLGVFFAFMVTILIAERMEKIGGILLLSITAVALVVNIFVGGSALQAALTYQQDTASLLKWLSSNVQFEYELASGAVVRVNADEPGNTLPKLAKMLYDKSYAPFIFTPAVRDILADPQTRYYLYGPNWGDQDLSRLGRIWYPVFVSKNWIMFRRLY